MGTEKGSTVFRPVARPRARTGTESRQPSAIPESLPSAAGPSRVQDGSRATSVMPPPSSVPSRFNADSSFHSSSTSDVGPEAAHSFGQPSAHPSQSSLSDVLYVPTVRPSHPRMPPMIGASQQTPHAAPVTQQTVGVSRHSASMATAGPPPAYAAPRLAPADADVFSGFHGLPTHLSGIDSPFPNIPFPIDPSQIGPQLMGHSAAFGIPPPAHSGIPVEQSFMDHRSAVDDSVAKSSRPRRSSRKRSNPNAGTAERDKEDDTHSERYCCKSAVSLLILTCMFHRSSRGHVCFGKEKALQKDEY